MMRVSAGVGSESGIGIESRTTVGQTGAYGNGINHIKGQGSLYKNSDIHKEKTFFSAMRDEVRVQLDEKDYFFNVAGRFKSGGLLEEKWGGRIGIEVYHRHKVGKIKKDALIGKKVPVVESDIPNIKHYRGPEDYLDERQENP
jgi:hypothetical protein